MNRKLYLTRCLGLLVALFSASAWAGNVTLPYFQAFNTDTTNFLATYPEFTLTNSSTTAPSPSVQSGVLHLPGINPAGVYSYAVTPNPLPSGQMVVDLDMGNTSSVTQARLKLGNNDVVFHPEHPAAFRIEGPGGFPNTATPFTPHVNILYHMHVVMDPSGLNSLTLTDPANPGTPFNTSWTNVGARTGSIGPAWFFGEGLYDNFSITAAVPEPAGIALMASMAGVFVKLHRSKRGSLRRSNS